MPDLEMVRRMAAKQPELNREICDGLAYSHMQHVEAYVNSVMRAAAKHFPAPLTYEDMEDVTPEAQFFEMSRARNGSRDKYEMTRTDMYLKRMVFSYAGVRMKPRYLQLPFMELGGYIHILGSQYNIMPTLVDPLFTVEQTKAFIALTQSKLTFNRMGYYYTHNYNTEVGESVHSVDVYWSMIYKTQQDRAPSNLKAQLVNYMLCHCGLTGTFRKYFGADIAYGTTEDINPTRYPAEDWVVCRSSGIQPQGRIQYVQPDVAIAVPRDQYTQAVQSAMGSVFYILDITTGIGFMRVEELDITTVWRRALSRFIWSEQDEREALAKVDHHLASIDRYMDEMVICRFRAEGIVVDTLMDVLQYSIHNFSTMAIENDPASTGGKMYSVLPIVLFDLTKMIFNLLYMLDRIGPDKINQNRLERLFDKHFKQAKVMSIKSGHPEVTIVDSATDNRVYKIATRCHPAHGMSARAKHTEMSNPAFRKHPTQCVSNSFGCVTKSAPTGIGSINPYVKLNDAGRILEDPELKPWLDELEKLM